ncbi:uncharacterized protein G2W53_035099 [Senna tora]|uniref:Uncharacterized protein n=1 Tax=Senna tora TaxID=362788 RepID=A0A834W781_9FABA|nr:uncharacterized protein G2W53_035099 [Senna tora]
MADGAVLMAMEFAGESDSDSEVEC